MIIRIAYRREHRAKLLQVTASDRMKQYFLAVLEGWWESSYCNEYKVKIRTESGQDNSIFSVGVLDLCKRMKYICSVLSTSSET